MKRDDNALLGKEFVEHISTRNNNRIQRHQSTKKNMENMKECNKFNLGFHKEKNVDHIIDGKNTVKTVDTYFYNTPITRTASIDSESDTISRAKMSINGHKRTRRLLTEPSQGDLNLAFIT